MNSGLLIGLLLVLLAIGAPVAVGLGLATIGLASFTGMPISRLPQTMISTWMQFPILAIPLFIIAGKIMSIGGIAERLIDLARVMVGHFRGGLGYVSILACMFFGAISGSALAATVTIGAIMIPAMVKAGHNREFSTALQASGAITDALIPPSVPMILFAVTGGVSVGSLFIAGIGPGIFVGLCLMGVVFISSYRNRANIRPEPRASFLDLLTAVRRGLLSLIMPIVVLGGIYGGIFTPTEAAAVAVIYGLIVGGLVYRKINLKQLGEILLSSGMLSAVLLFILGAASFFSAWITLERVPHAISAAFEAANLPTAVMLLLMLGLFLLLGMFMESSAALIITTPILLPVAVAAGVDPVHFGIFMLLSLGIGLLTPPVGLGLMVASEVGGTTFGKVLRPSLPFLGALLFATLVIMFVPEISLFLVQLMR